MKFNRLSTFVHSCRVVFKLNVKHKVIKTILYNSLFSANVFCAIVICAVSENISSVPGADLLAKFHSK